jgi:PD-(D/E)XK nuclease superfamily protein
MTHDRVRSLRAESTGSVAESSVRGVLTGRGYVELGVHEALEAAPAAEQTAMFRDFAQRPRPARLFVAQFPIGSSIYGLPLFADFWVRGAAHFPEGLAIEVKWQQSTGSVDEKFPYLALNIKECYPCPALVIADGGGQRPGALHWLRGQVDGNLMAVFSLAEFMAWANRNL